MTLKGKLMLAGVGVLALAGAGTAIAATAGQGHANPTAAHAGGDPVGARFGFAGPHVAGPRFLGALGGRHFGAHAGRSDDLAAAASYLGTTAADLATQLRAGKTLAQVANATSGKSAAGLVAALVAHEKKELADAVSAGRLTQAQADAMSARLEQRFTDLVNGVRPAGGPGFGHHGPGRFVDAAASYLGVSTATLLADLQSGKTLAQVANATSGKSADGLVAALVAQAKQDLAAAVSAGRLTQAQADAVSASLQQRITDLVNGARPFGGPAGHGLGAHGPGRLIDAASSYLGLTTGALLGDLRSGKTLAQVANATSGKSADGLIAALVAQEKKGFAGAVSAGRLTQAQADAIAADLQQRVTDLVNGVRPPFGSHAFGHGGPGGGGPDGPAGGRTGGNRI